MTQSHPSPADPTPGAPPDTDLPDVDPGAAAAPAATFGGLALRPGLLTALAALGYEEPTAIQRQALPPLLAGRDLLGQAATGTGKTAAFALPLLERLGAPAADPQPRGLVLAPTRELATQVADAIHAYGRRLGLRVLPVTGGQPLWRQTTALQRGVDVVVATPGRAVDHLGRGNLTLDRVVAVVLDEADEMLDLGFADDLDTLLAATPPTRQTMLFSATLPGRITALAARHLTDPVRITVSSRRGSPELTPRITQWAHLVSRAHKPAALGRVLDMEAPTAALVFCATRTEVDHLTEVLNGRGYRAEALHGGMAQEQRDRVMERLRNRTADLVVATDVAARGLDIDHLTHVVNHDVPAAPDAYVHRIGRVGRAGREGTAITLVEPRQRRLLRAIEQHTRQPIGIAPLPSVADLRARRLELTRSALEERLRSDEDLARYRGVVDSLSDEFDLLELALAAVAFAHDTVGGETDDEPDLPHLDAPSGGTDRDRPVTGRGSGGGRPGPAGGRGGAGRGKGGSRVPAAGMVRIYVGVGRDQGIRPKDLVGAIAGESNLPGKAVGTIEITPNFSLVEVPEAAAEGVIRALRNTTLKGRRATVRPDRHQPR